jgi:hypothetical protein
MSQQQQQLLKRDLTVSQILLEYGKKFMQIMERYSDGRNGKCAMCMLILAVGLLTMTFVSVQQQVEASSSGDADGKADAREDFLDANGDDSGKDISCNPQEQTDEYCLTYKLAYEWQWGQMLLQYDCSSEECK